MWIRTQDKFQITNGEITYKVWGCSATCWKIYLVNENNSNEEKEVIEVARYSSRAKALKVLDLLEEHIDHLDMSAIVFQFPQDEEIE